MRVEEVCVLHTVEIEFCNSWGYREEATRVVDIILDHYQPYLKALTLVPGDGGVFDLRVDGERVYSSLEQGGKFPSEDEVRSLVGTRVSAA